MADKAIVDGYLDIVTQAEIRLNGEFPNIFQALKEVLYRLPEDIFISFTKDMPLFFFVLPEIGASGGYLKEAHEPIDLKKGFRIIQLRAELNSMDIPSIMGVVIHEFAHAYLHCSYTHKGTEEEEADKLAIEWGFKNEIYAAGTNPAIIALREKIRFYLPTKIKAEEGANGHL